MEEDNRKQHKDNLDFQRGTTRDLILENNTLDSIKDSSSPFDDLDSSKTKKKKGPLDEIDRSDDKKDTEKAIPSLQDLLLSSAWRKWKEYGRFPFKLTLHILLVVFVTCYLLIPGGNIFIQLSTQRSLLRTWSYYFNPLLEKNDYLELKYTNYDTKTSGINNQTKIPSTYQNFRSNNKDGLSESIFYTNEELIWNFYTTSFNYFNINSSSTINVFFPINKESNGTITLVSDVEKKEILEKNNNFGSDGNSQIHDENSSEQQFTVFPQPFLVEYYIRNNEDNNNLVHYSWIIKSPEELLFTLTKNIDSFNKLNSGRIIMPICAKTSISSKSLCSCSNVLLVFTGGTGGFIKTTITQDSLTKCLSQDQASLSDYLLIAIVILSSIYLFLILKSLRERLFIYRTTKENYAKFCKVIEKQTNLHFSEVSSKEKIDNSIGTAKSIGLNTNITKNGYLSLDSLSPTIPYGNFLKKYPSWESIPFKIKRQFFNSWVILLLFSVIFLLMYSVISIYCSLKQWLLPDVCYFFLGIGTSLLYLTGLQFFKHLPGFYVFVSTVNSAIPKLVSYFVGVAPIFFGYAILGLAIFGDNLGLWSTLRSSGTALFCLMNGDNIFTICTALFISENYSILARIYIYSYIVLAIYVILNIIFSVVQQSFFISREAAELLQTDIHKIFQFQENMSTERKKFLARKTPTNMNESKRQEYIKISSEYYWPWKINGTESNVEEMIIQNNDQRSSKVLTNPDNTLFNDLLNLVVEKSYE